MSFWITFLFCLISIGFGMTQPLSPLFGYFLIFIGLVGILIISIKTFLYPKTKKQDEIFYNLNIPALKSVVGYWGDHWGDVKKIILYRAPASWPSVGGKSIKYVLYFQCKNVHSVLRQTLQEGKWGCDYLIIPLSETKDVYKKIPAGNYQDEWHCTAKLPKEVNKRHAVILYPI